MLPWARWRVCAAHQLLRARELDLARCGLKTHGLLRSALTVMPFSGSRSPSRTTFRNLHTPANRHHGESSDLWVRVKMPLVGPAMRQVVAPTW